MYDEACDSVDEQLEVQLADAVCPCWWADPVGAETIASVAGFASLHVSVVCTAAIVAHRLGLPRLLRCSLWVFLGATMLATAYFGWHYLVDVVAGLVISIWLALL